MLFLDLINGKLQGLKSSCITASVSSVTPQYEAKHWLHPPHDYRAAGDFQSCFFLQTFPCFKINFKIGSPGTLTAVSAGEEGTQQLFPPVKIL